MWNAVSGFLAEFRTWLNANGFAGRQKGCEPTKRSNFGDIVVHCSTISDSFVSNFDFCPVLFPMVKISCFFGPWIRLYRSFETSQVSEECPMSHMCRKITNVTEKVYKSSLFINEEPADWLM